MSRGRGQAPSDEDRALFQDAVKDARPLDCERAHIEPPAPAPRPMQRERDEQAALNESLTQPFSIELRLEGGDEPHFLRAGLARSVLKDLRRGRWVVQDALDLHGATRVEAAELLRGFLDQSLTRGLRCVRVIHGKGLGSPGREPVLKHLVRSWLGRREEVLAFCQARPAEGGEGALIVLLRAATPRP
jgi:DNA-nicking Smr family endonuclease